MLILNDFNTSVRKALEEIDPKYESYNGLIVCGTHSPNEEKITEALHALKQARENNTPTLGICFGLHLMVIEYARNVLKINDATSEEFGKGTLVVKKMPSLVVGLKNGESYWHQYEVDSLFLERMKKELFRPDYVAVQYHPEYQSSKDKPHRVLVNFLEYAKLAS